MFEQLLKDTAGFVRAPHALTRKEITMRNRRTRLASGMMVLSLMIASCTATALYKVTATQEVSIFSELEATEKPAPSFTPNPILVSFMPYADNPILVADPTQPWEAGMRFSTVVFQDGLFHMFYTGGDPFAAGGPRVNDISFAIGYATSTDGFTFTKFEGNPILKGDGSGFDAYSVSRPAVLVDGDTWVMYYTAHPEPGHPLGGPAIGRATASSPAGPWIRSEEPVLLMGSETEWDGEPGWFGIVPSSVFLTDEGYVIYYTSHHKGDISGPRVGGACGRATSEDGIRWTKYDNPATTQSPLAESDPVLRPDGPFDNLHAMDCRVFRTADGWGMVYASLQEAGTGHQLSFASSSDGIHWTKNEKGKPFLAGWEEPRASEAEVPDLWPDAILPYDSGYLLYYDIGCCPPIGIGVATGTIGR